ncbi:MAG: hypothetical protein EZS28_001995 [Streblomastix strix]|uniref:Uncharacterized protein n=1 Tax=Streblomastix strix TaxID=222440 RepID=A0A5J4X6I1_9EUKA|nr:MAG: hypothetical protein EZS28_001995 [Streblomastix strix]
MKTFTSTIISNGTQYSGYNNNSVFLAGGGVRSIADIYSASYTKSEDGDLLPLNADKTQLIDSYSKSETFAKDEIYTKTESNNLLNNKSDKGVSYTKSENDALLLLKADKIQLINAYSNSEDDALLLLKVDKTQLINSSAKSEDDALLLLKADKTQLIDFYNKIESFARDEIYTKTETNNLLNNKSNSGVSYTKDDDDALLLAKADKTQLIDSCTKFETNNLLNNKTDTGIFYTQGEDDTFLLPKAYKTQLIDSYTKTETNNFLNDKANQSTTYTKTETDNFVAQIEIDDVDMSNYYNKTETDELLGEKADTIELSKYMTLGISQIITANKTFNNSCRFVSSIDGMSTVTGSSFIKYGVNNIDVLLGAGDTKPVSEFGGTIDDSNYVKKTGQNLQLIHGYLRRDDDEMSELSL